MKATLLNFVFASLVAVSLGVRSRAHELRGGATDVEKRLDEPAAPRWEGEGALRRLRRRGQRKCQRTRNFGAENTKITTWCARQCAACENLAEGRREACREDFCRADNPVAPGDVTVERGCSRSNKSRKLSRFCTATCRWCAEARRCNGNPNKEDERGEDSEACNARRCQAKCRCRFANCPGDGEDGLPDLNALTCPNGGRNQEYENCDAQNSPLQLPETAARIEEEFDEEEFFAMAMELGLPGDEEDFHDEDESFAAEVGLAPPGPDGMSMPP